MVVASWKDDRDTEEPKASFRSWVGLAVIALSCVLFSIDRTMLPMAAPLISLELRPTHMQLLWIVDIYGFLVAGTVIAMGSVGDRIGHRRLLLLGAATFGVGSVLAANSVSAAMLVGARGVLGLAAATLVPSTLSLIRQAFGNSQQRLVAIGIWASSFSFGAALGPLLGGLLLGSFGWRSVFWMAVPVIGILLVLVPLSLPESMNHDSPRKIDAVSTVLFLASVLSGVYGLKATIAGLGQWWPLVWIWTSAGLGTFLVLRQRREKYRFIDVSVFRLPAAATALIAYTIVCFVISGVSYTAIQFMQLAIGLSPLQTGLYLVPATLGSVAGALLTRVVARFAPISVIGVGLLVAAIGAIVIALASHVHIVASGLLIIYFGIAQVGLRALSLIVGMAPVGRAGQVSAIFETGAELGSALGVALLGSIGGSVYRYIISQNMPAGMTYEDVHQVRNAIGGAFAIAQRLPDGLSAQLHRAASLALESGLHVTAILSAGMLFVSGVGAAILLRK